tara:strand:- start:460 stop:651 length:192 start_codon:yes stop_codon:yes gene_type:complete
MTSSKDNDEKLYSSDDEDSFSHDADYEKELDKWDEWYDESEFQNKRSKIRRSKKRLYKQRDEW